MNLPQHYPGADIPIPPDDLRNVLPIGGLNPRPMTYNTLRVIFTAEIEVESSEGDDSIEMRVDDALRATQKALPGFNVEVDDYTVGE